jgi:hypothetical protein
MSHSSSADGANVLEDVREGDDGLIGGSNIYEVAARVDADTGSPDPHDAAQRVALRLYQDQLVPRAARSKRVMTETWLRRRTPATATPMDTPTTSSTWSAAT